MAPEKDNSHGNSGRSHGNVSLQELAPSTHTAQPVGEPCLQQLLQDLYLQSDPWAAAASSSKYDLLCNLRGNSLPFPNVTQPWGRGSGSGIGEADCPLGSNRRL